ncbi:EamA family transporter [Novosphingobium aerophilum]|uniref:EamA family transporter n=1 Tax=Novosphingobium aerophilum TaxID=2839843 RepID=UPI003FD0D87A
MPRPAGAGIAADMTAPTDRTALLAGLSIVVAQASINLGAAFAKSLFPIVGPEGVAALRTAISAVILLAIARPWRSRMSGRQLGWLLVYGLVLGGMNLMIYWAFRRIPIGIGVAIEICGPLGVVLATSRSLRDFLWLGLALGGLALLIPWPGRAAPLDLAGIGFALGAAACWALYILCGKRAAQVGSSTAVSIGMTVACLVTVPFGIASAPASLPLPALGLGFVVAILSSALPYMLEMRAMTQLPSRIVGLLSSMAPALGAIVGFAVLGERLTGLQWLAVAMMIAASAGCSLAARSPVASPRDEAMA